MFSIVVNVDGLNRKFDTLATSAEDLHHPLRIFGGYLKKKAQDKFKEQSFQGLAESTVQHRAQAGLRSLERKLHRELKKAVQRGQPKDKPRGVLARFLGSGGSVNDVTSVMTRGVRNRSAVLAEFQSRHRRGLEERAQGSKLSVQQLASLSERETRAVARATGRPILGKLSEALIVEVNQFEVRLVERTGLEWSAVHNEDGTAGHGAKIPRRETLKLTDADVDVLGEILEFHLLKAFKDGSG